MRIVFLTRSLEVGGTERQLVNLAAGLQAKGHIVTVLTFYPGGPFAEELTRLKVNLRSLDKRGRWDVVGFARSLRREISALKPDVVYSLLPIPNLVAAFALARMRPRPRLVWGLRSASMDLTHYDLMIRLTYRAERALRSLPDAIVANSEAARRAWGNQTPIDVIPNGIDVHRFAIDRSAGQRLRSDLGIATDAIVVGTVGRLDPVKDHRTFLLAAAHAAKSEAAMRFLVVGDGDRQYERDIKELAQRIGIGEAVHWIGARSDMPAVYNAMDVLALSSTSEAFPNVLAESLACGVPSVATDVGDCRTIVADDRYIVPSRDPAALAEAIRRALHDDRVGEERRQRIVANFSTEALVDRTEELLLRVSSR